MDKPVWKLEDLIDLEWQFQQDAERADEDLHRRDRQIHQERILPEIGVSDRQEPRRVIRLWFDEIRRQSGGKDAWPGRWYVAGYRVVAGASVVVAVLTGSAAANLLCAYEGVHPINVYAFLWIAVFSQILLMLGLVVAVFGVRHLSVRGSSGLLHRLWRWLIETVARRLSPRLSGAMRDRAQAGANVWRTSMAVYGGVWYWPILAVRQMFGTMFNLSMLLTFLGLVMFRDLAFAWESTGVLNPEKMYALVSAVAAPWSWFAPQAHPTMQQIALTHYEARTGIAVMPTEALRSWWPFLAYAMCVYGLLPRALMWWWARLMQRRAVRRVRFDHGSCKRLLDRLRLPMVSTRGSEPGFGIAYPDGPGAAAGGVSSPCAMDDSHRPQAITAGSCVVVKWGEMPISDDRIGAVLGRQWSLDVMAVHPAGGPDLEQDNRTITAIAGQDFPGQPTVVLVVEAWEEPTNDFGLFVRDLRCAIGATADIVVALTGRPENDEPSPATEADFTMWKRFMQNLADPYLRLERLGGAA